MRCGISGRMVDPIFQSANYQVARKLLDATALRQEAIAANIANAETPGYRRVDVGRDFASQLKAATRSGQAVLARIRRQRNTTTEGRVA